MSTITEGKSESKTFGRWLSEQIISTLLFAAMLAVLGFVLNERLEQLKSALAQKADAQKALLESSLRSREWTNQTLIQNRIKIYTKVNPDLDRLFSYFTCVGDWKDIRPNDTKGTLQPYMSGDNEKELLKIKRKVDNVIYENFAFFTPIFLENYNRLMNIEAFKIYNGIRKDAQLKTNCRFHYSKKECANADVAGRFVINDDSDREVSKARLHINEFEKRYFELMASFGQSFLLPEDTGIPSNAARNNTNSSEVEGFNVPNPGCKVVPSS
jgi:hypothetical protein